MILVVRTPCFSRGLSAENANARWSRRSQRDELILIEIKQNSIEVTGNSTKLVSDETMGQACVFMYGLRRLGRVWVLFWICIMQIALLLQNVCARWKIYDFFNHIMKNWIITNTASHNKHRRDKHKQSLKMRNAYHKFVFNIKTKIKMKNSSHISNQPEFMKMN